MRTYGGSPVVAVAAVGVAERYPWPWRVALLVPPEPLPSLRLELADPISVIESVTFYEDEAGLERGLCLADAAQRTLAAHGFPLRARRRSACGAPAPSRWAAHAATRERRPHDRS